MNIAASLWATLPELGLLVSLLLILMGDVFVKESHRVVTPLLVQSTLLLAVALVAYQMTWSDFGQIFWSGNYIIDRFALFSKLVIFTFALFALVYARPYVESHRLLRSEYYLLALFSIIGMSVMTSANNLIALFLGLELLSLPLYAMVAIDRYQGSAIEAGMKYFILGSFATGLLLYGMSFLYGVTGSVEFGAIAQSLTLHVEPLVLVGVIFVLAGLLFKLGLMPFHAWVPDVYEGAPVSTTLWIASVPKMAAFVLLIRLLVVALPDQVIHWQPLLVAISVISMLFGNLIAIVQTNLKRLFAYSSIAHMGYVLLGVIAGPNAPQGYEAALFYMLNYVLSAMGGFAIITIMSSQGLNLETMDDFRGLNSRHPWIAFLFLLILFSMAGVPPMVGFFAKLGLLEALVHAHYVWLAAAALLFALIGAYYYLRVVMMMYFEEPASGKYLPPVTVTPAVGFAITLNGLAMLVFGLFPSPLIEFCRMALSF